MQFYQVFLYLAFGILPSLTWLFYYLRKDLHPEPKRMILKIFFYGALITIPVLFIQIGLSRFLVYGQDYGFFIQHPLLVQIIRWFFIVALTEELFKYAVVRLSILHSGELDEPLDIMLYMVVGALGFAAVENVLYLFLPNTGLSLDIIITTTVTISFIRFIGATFLHTLCAALVGYFLARATLKAHHGKQLVIIGLVLATFLHGLYDFSIIRLSEPFSFLIPVGILIVLTGFMMYDFDEIKKVKSICKLN